MAEEKDPSAGEVFGLSAQKIQITCRLELKLGKMVLILRVNLSAILIGGLF